MNRSSTIRSLTTLNLALALTASTGCVIVSDDGSGGDASASSTSEGSTSGESSSGGSSEGSSEGSGSVGSTSSGSTSSGSTSSGSTSDGSTSGTTGGDACPAAEDAYFEFALLPEPDFGDLAYEWECKILAIQDALESGKEFVLSCSSGGVEVDPAPTLWIDASPAPAYANLIEGMGIRVIYGQYVPWWTEKWLRVEDLEGGQLLVAAVSGSSLAPDPNVDVFAPIQVGAHEGVCAVMEEGCGMVERLELSFAVDGAEDALVDSSFGIVGGVPGYSAWASRATHYVGDILCTDTPDSWFSVGVIADGQE